MHGTRLQAFKLKFRRFRVRFYLEQLKERRLGRRRYILSFEIRHLGNLGMNTEYFLAVKGLWILINTRSSQMGVERTEQDV